MQVPSAYTTNYTFCYETPFPHLFLFMVSRLVAESPDDSGVSSSLCLLYKPLYVAVRTSKNGLWLTVVRECFCLYVCVYHMCAWYPRRLESGIKSLGTGVAVVSYHMDVGSRQEQQALSHLSSPNVKHLTLKMLAKASTLGDTCISS